MHPSYAVFAVVVATFFVDSNAVVTTQPQGQIKLAEVSTPNHIQSAERNTDMNRLLRSGYDLEDDVDSEERGFENYYKVWHKNGETSAAIKKDLGIAGLVYRYGKRSEKLLARDEYKKWKGYKAYLKTHPLD
ncbi:hypothetical protein PHMEG_00027430 [Phytophthora megakarya]|uniref:RxLR effector protein n=1 Tax=Phytophthora megakarya TaxID=4795 RepID=A0A225V783_9STRA|nr:hypothetical protein PHMEG_00027430 [Phytophthora megakarya]